MKTKKNHKWNFGKWKQKEKIINETLEIKMEMRTVASIYGSRTLILCKTLLFVNIKFKLCRNWEFNWLINCQIEPQFLNQTARKSYI